MIKIIKRVFVLAGELSINIKKSFFFGFVDSLFQIAPFVVIIYFFDLIDNHDSMTRGTIIIFSLILFVGLIGRIVFKYLVYRYQSGAGYEIIARERLKIGDRLKRVPMGFFNENNMGEITTTITTDLNFLEMYAMHVLDKVANGYISTLVVSLFIFFFDWRIGIIFILGMVGALLVYQKIQKQMKKVSKTQKKVQAKMVFSTLEYIQGMAIIKAFNVEKMHSKQIDNDFDEHSEACYNIEKTFVPIYGLYSICFKIAIGCILFLAPILFLEGEFSLVKMATAIIATFTVFVPMEIMGSMTAMIRLMEASLDRVDSLKNTPCIDANAKDIKIEKFDIEFKNVHFSYQKDTEIIKNLSFSIPEKSMTALVGPSGCGKTTITRLMARFWDVSKGKVEIGGIDVKDITCDSLLNNISMVFQDVYLFNDTIINNIKFGKTDATMEEVIHAAKKARCHDFIMTLDNGYNTVVGEGGATLSGGEKQRISIARAMIKDAPIILLDEATASVDPENEHLIQEAICALVKEKTLVVIAHRLSTIREANQILVMDNGEIVQRGSHKELISQQGMYKNFWEVRKKARSWKIN